MPIDGFTPETDFGRFGIIQKDFTRVCHPMIVFTGCNTSNSYIWQQVINGLLSTKGCGKALF